MELYSVQVLSPGAPYWNRMEYSSEVVLTSQAAEGQWSATDAVNKKQTDKAE